MAYQYNGQSYQQQQSQPKLVSIHDIMNARQTPQERIANSCFNTGPGYTTAVIFSGQGETTTYNNPKPYPYHYGYYPQNGGY